MLMGRAPGRPVNVGFVEHELAALSGILQQVADLLWVQRSALILAMEFVLMMVLTRLVIRKKILAGRDVSPVHSHPHCPAGSFASDIVFAALSLGVVFYVMMRFRLLPAVVGCS
jgi:hypothetical protein